MCGTGKELVHMYTGRIRMDHEADEPQPQPYEMAAVVRMAHWDSLNIN